MNSKVAYVWVESRHRPDAGKSSANAGERDGELSDVADVPADAEVQSGTQKLRPTSEPVADGIVEEAVAVETQAGKGMLAACDSDTDGLSPSFLLIRMTDFPIVCSASSPTPRSQARNRQLCTKLSEKAVEGCLSVMMLCMAAAATSKR